MTDPLIYCQGMLVTLLVFSNLALMWKIPEATHASKKDDLASDSFLHQKMKETV